jgi:hypothetical protein
MFLEADREKLAGQKLTDEEEARIFKSYRAGGDVVCPTCGKTYYKHPQYLPSGKTNDGVPWLVEICNGNLVKL